VITAAWVAEQRGDDPGILGAHLVAAYDRAFLRPEGIGAR
jgi:hypothetical protein